MRDIGEFIKGGGYFPNNILVNFVRNVRFEKASIDENAGIQFGRLHLPDKYRSAWIIDGQHRLYGFAPIDDKYLNHNVIVVAFETLSKTEEANLFVTINHEQKSVPKHLLDDLEGELKENGQLKRGPSWGELVTQAAKELGFEPAELLRARGTDLQILEYFKLKFSGHTQLTNWLLVNMRPPDDAIRYSPIHKELAAMTRCMTLYTTNFDDFLERSLKLHGRQSQAVAIESHMRPNVNTTEVVKFHGDWNHPDRMVLTESDYERRMEFKSMMDRRLWSDLLNRSLLFIGYSFRDPNVAYLFRQVKEQFAELPNSSSGRRAYIIVQDPSLFERRLFQERNIEVIPVSGRDRAGAIAELLDSIRS